LWNTPESTAGAKKLPPETIDWLSLFPTATTPEESVAIQCLWNVFSSSLLSVSWSQNCLKLQDDSDYWMALLKLL
jgi:hypothetical protein